MDTLDTLLAAGRAAILVGLAELGDKSQLVCLVLGTRYGARPVLAGAALAFALLNAMAAAVGGAVGAAIPPRLMAWIAAALFTVFGLLALLGGDDEDEQPRAEVPTGRSGAAVTFGTLLVAELGDKTQLAVAALAADSAPIATWAGSTLALVSLAGLGAAAGQAALDRLHPRRLQRVGGLLFLATAAWSVLEALG